MYELKTHFGYVEPQIQENGIEYTFEVDVTSAGVMFPFASMSFITSMANCVTRLKHKLVKFIYIKNITYTSKTGIFTNMYKIDKHNS